MNLRLPRVRVPLAPTFFLLLSAAISGPTQAFEGRSAQPSVQAWPPALQDTIHFLVHEAGMPPIGVARVHNAGYRDFIPGYDVALWSRDTITLNGYVCVDGHVHADSGITSPERFLCEGTWTSGPGVDPPVAFTTPDSFPGATYYYLAANDGPGWADTLFIKDRNWNTLRFYIKGVTVPDRPAPDFNWAYDSRNGGVLDVRLHPTNSLDQVAGPFPRIGSDFTVVVNFGGRDSYMKHAKTNLQLWETGLFIIQSTIINTRYSSTAGTGNKDRLTSTNWTGGDFQTRTKSNFQPLNGLAFLAQTVQGNAQVLVGTSTAPALAYITEDADLSNGQWTLHGCTISLGNIRCGGGVTAQYDGFDRLGLPPWLHSSQHQLEITSATITGPHASRFSVGDFQPFRVGADPVAVPILFSDNLALPRFVYQASLVLTTRNAGDSFGMNLANLTWLLRAQTDGQNGFQYPAVWAEDIHLAGNVCVDGFVHANDFIYRADHLSCGVWDFGYQIDPQPLRTAPESFPGATYYYVEANDGPGRSDTLFIKDRHGATIGTYISDVSKPDTPHPGLCWSFDREPGILSIEIDAASEVLDQENGPFPRLGSDSTVVINFHGRGVSYHRHYRTDLTLKDGGNGPATGDGLIRSTLINTLHCCPQLPPWQLVREFDWNGGLTRLKGRVRFAPSLGLALLVKSIEGGSQVEIGIPGRPALTYVTGDGEFSSGQVSVRGQLIALGDLHLGGGFDAVYDTGFEDDLPGWILYGALGRPDVPEDTSTPEASLRTAAVSASELTRAAVITRVTPNPFLSSISIEFNLAQPGHASLYIFDAQGRLIRNVLDREMDAGAHSATWDGRTDRGAKVRSGLYFARLLSGGTSVARRLVRLE